MERRKFVKCIISSSVLSVMSLKSMGAVAEFSIVPENQNYSSPEKNERNKEMKKVGIIICDRWNTCAGGKCLRSLRKKEGAFEKYKNDNIELVGYTTCGGCPGGNVEYAPEEMKKNGAEIVHLATGFLVGYPPCPHIEYFSKFVPEKYGMDVVIGTHPIPEKYYTTHKNLKTWEDSKWQNLLKETICDRDTRLRYD